MSLLHPLFNLAYARLTSIPPLIVVGMHRSGTSLLTRLLERCGVFMGICLTGNGETPFFQNINRTTLDLLGYSWRCLDLYPTTSTLFRYYQWRHKQIVREIKVGLSQQYLGVRKAINLLLNSQGFRWGWKDPRNSITLPFWAKVFPEATVVHIYRDGRDVALSLLARESKREVDKSYRSQQENEARFLADFTLWELYIQRIQEGIPFFQQSYTLQYEQLLANPGSEIQKLLHALKLPIPANLPEIVTTIDEGRSGRYLQNEFAWTRQLTLNTNLLTELGYQR